MAISALGGKVVGVWEGLGVGVKVEVGGTVEVGLKVGIVVGVKGAGCGLPMHPSKKRAAVQPSKYLRNSLRLHSSGIAPPGAIIQELCLDKKFRLTGPAPQGGAEKVQEAVGGVGEARFEQRLY
jgi:hypothetical protein